MVQTPYFVAYQPVLWGFGASFCKMRGLIAKPPIFHKPCHSLKALTSLNKEVRPFFLGDHSIWSFPSVSRLRRLQHLEVLKDIFVLRSQHLEHFSSLSPNTIIAKEKWNLRGLASLFKEVMVFKVCGGFGESWWYIKFQITFQSRCQNIKS